ncbi:hypothetical protein BH23ACT9_BH23ACT9_06130 [soil metagenome]
MHTSARPRRLAPLSAVIALAVAVTAALLSVPAEAQPTAQPTAQQAQPTAPVAEVRVGGQPDPVQAAVALHQARGESASRAVVGRSDVFADNLAATALVGTDGVLLLTDGGPDARVRPEVLAELRRTLTPAPCDAANAPEVLLAGGPGAVSDAVADAIAADGFCVRRLEGASRVETAVAIADAVPDPSGTVVLARADDWADAGAVGAWAAATGSRILVTPTDGLHPAAAEALSRYAPDQIVLVGGTAALSTAVEEAAAEVAPTRRIAGEARDGTAAAIATQLWDRSGGGDVAVADGYDDRAWTYLFAGAAFAGSRGLPVLYTNGRDLAPGSVAALQDDPAGALTAIGPRPLRPTADLDAARVAGTEVASMAAPLMLKPRPGGGELWVAERAGVIRAIGGEGVRTVLDIRSTVTTAGEGGLLGFAIHPDGTRLFTSSTNTAGDSVIDEFAITGDEVDVASRRQLLLVGQPASNHNGGDLHFGPDGQLWWSLGDGGGGGDTYRQGQRPDTLLAAMVRIDVDGGEPYAIPADNPFADGAGGAPELWAYGLRNPFRFAFDALEGDLYIADVGQSAVEEINWISRGAGAGSNFGWPVFEGNRPFGGGDLADHVPPVWEQFHSSGNCSITGGVVYRGEAIPALYGAYLYSDLCNNSVRAILVEDGRVTQDTDLGVTLGTPVGFGVDHDGEVYVMGLGGPIIKLMPA